MIPPAHRPRLGPLLHPPPLGRLRDLNEQKEQEQQDSPQCIQLDQDWRNSGMNKSHRQLSFSFRLSKKVLSRVNLFNGISNSVLNPGETPSHPTYSPVAVYAHFDRAKGVLRRVGRPPRAALRRGARP